MSNPTPGLALLAILSTLSANFALAQTDREYEPVLKIAPVYPEAALAEGLAGHVWVEYTITAAGTVADARVTESSSSVFDDAALDAVKQFRYQPRILDGEAVAVSGVRIRLLFRPPEEH